MERLAACASSGASINVWEQGESFEFIRWRRWRPLALEALAAARRATPVTNDGNCWYSAALRESRRGRRDRDIAERITGRGLASRTLGSGLFA
jgi:hypothetical protein